MKQSSPWKRRLVTDEGTSYGLPSFLYVQVMDKQYSMPEYRKPAVHGYFSFGYRRVFVEMPWWVPCLVFLIIGYLLGR